MKTLGTVCTRFQHIDSNSDSPEEASKKQFYNRIIADKKPYFFKYKYPSLNKELMDYDNNYNEMAFLKFGAGLKDVRLFYKNVVSVFYKWLEENDRDVYSITVHGISQNDVEKFVTTHQALLNENEENRIIISKIPDALNKMPQVKEFEYYY